MRTRESDAPVVILLGPPGSGKGTQSAFLQGYLSVPAISTGELLRSECESGSVRGNELRQLLAEGKLASDGTVNALVADRLAQPSCRNGFILDGYPRTVAQADFLRDLIRRHGHSEPTILHFKASRQTLVNRLSGRRQCSSCSKIYNLFYLAPADPHLCDDDGAPLTQRADDREYVVLQRLTVYEKTTKPLVNYYRSGDFHVIDAGCEESEVRENLRNVFSTFAVPV